MAHPKLPPADGWAIRHALHPSQGAGAAMSCSQWLAKWPGIVALFFVSGKDPLSAKPTQPCFANSREWKKEEESKHWGTDSIHHCTMLDPSPMGALHPSEGREGFVEGHKEAENLTLYITRTCLIWRDAFLISCSVHESSLMKLRRLD